MNRTEGSIFQMSLNFPISSKLPMFMVNLSINILLWWHCKILISSMKRVVFEKAMTLQFFHLRKRKSAVFLLNDIVLTSIFVKSQHLCPKMWNKVRVVITFERNRSLCFSEINNFAINVTKCQNNPRQYFC